MSALFTPTRIGPYELAHRVVMAPLTRMRSEVSDVPGELLAAYDRQRATQGSPIIAEATQVAANGNFHC